VQGCGGQRDQPDRLPRAKRCRPAAARGRPAGADPQTRTRTGRSELPNPAAKVCAGRPPDAALNSTRRARGAEEAGSAHRSAWGGGREARADAPPQESSRAGAEGAPASGWPARGSQAAVTSGQGRIRCGSQRPGQQGQPVPSRTKRRTTAGPGGARAGREEGTRESTGHVESRKIARDGTRAVTGPAEGAAGRKPGSTGIRRPPDVSRAGGAKAARASKEAARSARA